ncbi:MAG: DEAD/DEAH box helicase [Saprospiraceae bacterium]|nr:DEAD/DEAH box helicase [Saprospiraceae bacterium]
MEMFKNLGLNEDLLRGIEELGFSTPTPVQELVIPTALTSTGDIVALAQTGTGKTAAFGLPLLQLIDLTERHVQGLVLCPTRELCVQVAGDLVNYAKFAPKCKVTAVYGGANIETQIRQIKSGVQIIVATPGRLIDLIERGAVNLDQMKRLVLDEADEMLNMGFKDDLDTILASATNKQSVWLFSATMSNEVRAISRNYMTDPIELTTGRRNETNENIEHIYYVCRADDRYSVLKRVVDSHPGIFGLIFCRTKAETKEVAEQMTRDGYNSDALHGDLSQNDRDRVMLRFREGNLQLLIATDVAARGIDVSDITHVINYGLPDDIEVYTHRSGRTGRAGKKGTSITIVTTKYEERIPQIERINRAKFKRLPIPTGVEVCEAQLMQIIKNVHEAEVQHTEIEPYLPAIYEELEELSKEELIKRFASMEFNRFLTYYKDAPDLNPRRKRVEFMGSSSDSRSFSRSNGQQSRLFVNIGEMDGLSKRDFIHLLGDNFNIPNSAIGRVDIKKSYLHFDVDTQFVDRLKSGLQKATFNGRKLRVDDATDSRKEKEVGGGDKKRFNDRFSDKPKPEFGYDKKKKDSKEKDKKRKVW